MYFDYAAVYAAKCFKIYKQGFQAQEKQKVEMVCKMGAAAALIISKWKKNLVIDENCS